MLSAVGMAMYRITYSLDNLLGREFYFSVQLVDKLVVTILLLVTILCLSLPTTLKRPTI